MLKFTSCDISLMIFSAALTENYKKSRFNIILDARTQLYTHIFQIKLHYFTLFLYCAFSDLHFPLWSYQQDAIHVSQ